MSKSRKPRKGFKPRKRPFEQLQGMPPTTERYNAYECDTCHGIFISVDLNPGITPMLSRCFSTEGCRGHAKSKMYPSGGTKPPDRLGPVIIEWFRPTNIDSYSFEMQEHLRKGGLARRAAPAAPDWVKRIA